MINKLQSHKIHFSYPGHLILMNDGSLSVSYVEMRQVVVSLTHLIPMYPWALKWNKTFGEKSSFLDWDNFPGTFAKLPE